MCEVGCTVWGMPDKYCTQDCNPYPEPKIDGNRLVSTNSVEAPFRVFRFTLQGLLIYRSSASHCYLRLLNQLPI
jgi:hypothetical protein